MYKSCHTKYMASLWKNACNLEKSNISTPLSNANQTRSSNRASGTRESERIFMAFGSWKFYALWSLLSLRYFRLSACLAYFWKRENMCSQHGTSCKMFFLLSFLVPHFSHPKYNLHWHALVATPPGTTEWRMKICVYLIERDQKKEYYFWGKREL